MVRTWSWTVVTQQREDALITGAAGDISRATAVRLAGEGAHVVLADIANGIDTTAAMCAEVNAAATPVTVTFDVTDELEV